MIFAWETAVERLGSSLRVPSLKSWVTSSFSLGLVLEDLIDEELVCASEEGWRYDGRVLYM